MKDFFLFPFVSFIYFWCECMCALKEQKWAVKVLPDVKVSPGNQLHDRLLIHLASILLSWLSCEAPAHLTCLEIPALVVSISMLWGFCISLLVFFFFFFKSCSFLRCFFYLPCLLEPIFHCVIIYCHRIEKRNMYPCS